MSEEIKKDDFEVVKRSIEAESDAMTAESLYKSTRNYEIEESEKTAMDHETVRRPQIGAQPETDLHGSFDEILKKTTPWGTQWDPKEVVSKLRNVTRRVEELWKGQKGISYIAERGPAHNLHMIKVLYEHFRDDLHHLSVQEFRLLLAAVWLHDIGMAVGLKEGKNAELILEQYASDSANYIRAHPHELGLSEGDEDVVSNLCQHHRMASNLADLVIQDKGVALPVRRQKLLLAYLRMADALAIRSERVLGRHLAFFDKRPTDREAHDEWLRNLFVNEVSRRDTTLAVQLWYKPSWGEAKIRQLMDHIRNDIQGTLDMVKDFLIVDGKCRLLWVKTEGGPEPPSDMEIEMEYVLNGLGTMRSPNAGRVVDYVLATLQKRLERKDLNAIEEYVSGELKELAQARPSYFELRRIQDEINKAITGKEEEGKDKIECINVIVSRYQKFEGNLANALARTAAQIFTKPCCFLVFGYSAGVISALDGLQPEVKEKSSVIVLECRNKTVYSFNNAVDYSDGVEYALAIRQKGFTNVWVSSDVALASIYEEETSPDVCSMESPPRPDYLLLGTNGIGPDGSIVSTAGYLNVALVAENYRTPIYVVAATTKFTSATKTGNRRRENKWLSTDRGLEAKVENLRLYMPGEDIVPSRMITKFLTEKGEMTPEQISRMTQEGQPQGRATIQAASQSAAP